MKREEAKKMAQSRDCHCIKGKDRDTNYNACIDKIFDWHENELKNLTTQNTRVNCLGLEEKLQEILTDHLEDIERNRTEQTNLIALMKFCQTHKFEEEERMTRVKFDATAMIIYGWEKMHKEIQKLLL